MVYHTEINNEILIPEPYRITGTNQVGHRLLKLVAIGDSSKLFEPEHEKTNNLGFFPITPDTNWPVQPQKQARSLKFWV